MEKAATVRIVPKPCTLLPTPYTQHPTPYALVKSRRRFPGAARVLLWRLCDHFASQEGLGGRHASGPRGGARRGVREASAPRSVDYSPTVLAAHARLAKSFETINS